MDVELVTIGDELLLGFTVDSNAAYLARALASNGVRVVRHATVGDDQRAITDAVAQALVRTGRVITTGGLGPTSDDRTKDAVAAIFHRGMRFHEPIWESFVNLWKQRGYPGDPPNANRRQAMIPDGGTILQNRHGTAPGVFLEDDRHRWVAMLPGVPRELRGMTHDVLLPLLQERGANGTVVRSLTIRTTGVAESRIADLLGPLGEGTPEMDVAFIPGADGVDVRLTSASRHPAESDRMLEAARREFLARIGTHVYGQDDDDLAAVVLSLARDRRIRLAVAESCTGGLLGGRLTSVPGASDVLAGGVIAYANDVKVRELSVPESTIAKYGAVSEEVALAMASGARRRFRVELAIAITGIAGPDGGSDAKPVGTVWCAIDHTDRARTWRRVLPGDREEIRRRATQMALSMTRQSILARD